ncbi:MAG: mechanosensitive ion channel domain-containing protein [Casimicrobiaceae bacterium]
MFCRFAVAGVLAACMIVTGAALAQSASSPKTTTTGTPSEKVAASSGPADARVDVRKNLEAAQSRLDTLEAAADGAAGAPPGTPPGEIAEHLALARQQAALYQQQLDVLDRMESARRERAEAEQALSEWQGFPTPPPYSVLVVDALRDDVDNVDARIASTAQRRTLFDRFSVELAVKSKASQAAARLAAEAAESAAGTPAQLKLVWARDGAILRARVDEATRELLDMAVRNAREESAAASVERDLAVRKLAAAGNEFTLGPDDVAKIRSELDARKSAVNRAVERALMALTAANEARNTVQARLARERALPAKKGEEPAARAARETMLEREGDVKREVASSAALRVDLLKEYLLLLEGEHAAWEARADAMSLHNPVEARAAYEKLAGSLATVRTWQEYLGQQLATARARIKEQETKLRSSTGDAIVMTTQLLEAFRQRETDLNRAIEQGQPLERLLHHFRTDFEGRREVSYVERLKDRAAEALLRARRVWNYEVATVEDSYETADGRKLSVSRSVTLGKSVGAMLIVILGYLVCSFVTRRIERLAVSRGGVAPRSAALLRNWVLFLLTAILVVFALFSASIPLTAFAFLGGALAIAAGFGLQTLLKNFVAGIMLLFKGPMRLDDLVEVDGIRGRVTAIGIRASTILSADGIESMIPNSAFVEGKLTNWTFSNAQNRQTIRVGVAYGSPLRKVADALADVLSRHGLVLKDPAPQVYLDDYTDNAVSFALTYWVNMTPDNDTRRIRSDLLHMIDRAFAETGIRMPFPQRDVHVDAATPLKVEIVPPPAAGTAE